MVDEATDVVCGVGEAIDATVAVMDGGATDAADAVVDDATDPANAVDAVGATTEGICAETVVVLVTEVVVTVGLTHFPPIRISPSELEQVLQATPPSL
jgi:hypothetical protein